MKRILLTCLSVFALSAAYAAYAEEAAHGEGEAKEQAEEQGEEKAKEEIVDPSSLTPEEREAIQLDSLVRNLKSGEYHIVEYSIGRLQDMGDPAVKPLADVVADEDNEAMFRMNAVYALGRIGNKSKRALPLLVKLLHDQSEDMRAVAAIAIGRIGENGFGAVEKLEQLLSDDSDWVRESAEKGLRGIGTKKALDVLNARGSGAAGAAENGAIR